MNGSWVRLRERIGVIFQDFVRYQLKVGENIGVGAVGNIGFARFATSSC